MITSVEFIRETLRALINLSIDTALFWLPVALGYVLFWIWMKYIQAKYFASLKHVLLEFKVPREVPKSPLAMELFLNSLHQTTGESTWYDRIVLGKVRAYFSLEIVSIEGDVRFFIRTREFIRKHMETQFYSQFPDGEVREVPDYTLNVPFAQEDSDWDMFGVEFILSKPDAYPIKTYVDYGLLNDPKDELKIDPITPVIEYMGDLGRGEQAWFQILVRSNKGLKDPTSYWGKRAPWAEDGKKLIDEIMEKAKDRSGTLPEEAQQDFRFSMLTEGEREIIKAIERNISKLGFDCGIRSLYLAKKGRENWDNIAGIFGTMKQYNSNNLNSFRPRVYTDVDYPWQKYIDIPVMDPPPPANFFSFTGNRIEQIKWHLFNAYRRRSWFFPPYERKPFVLNSEELATIFHFPGRVSETPTFERIESKKSEPPANLPS
jgi:hypothetical protein